jgi:transcriptional antiterminator RfaH
MEGEMSPQLDGMQCRNTGKTRNGERRWYVVKTKPRDELLCRKEIERRGIETLCPMTREYRFRRRRQEVVPMFPGYVFVRFAFPEDYDLVRWARGVSSLVRFGVNDPPVLDEGIVLFFIERMDEEGIIDITPDLEPGQKVRFLSEPLRDMVGTITRCETAKGRVQVLMDVLYQATVEVENYQVQPL